MIEKEITVKSALNNVTGRFPYNWDLNIYRGCMHQCAYCFAMYSHQYLKKRQDKSSFFNEIYIKTNIADILDKTISAKKINNEIINIGGICDSYQPLERKYELMKPVLKILIQHRQPIIISTKSDLILRDFNLISRLSNIASVNIAISLITLDDKLKSIFEPNASSPLDRLNILKEFKKTNATLGLHLMPILPMLTDNKEDLERIFLKAKEIGVDYIITGDLYLRGPTKPFFLNILKETYPEIYPHYSKLYPNGKLIKVYAKKLASITSKLKRKYQLTDNFNQILSDKKKSMPILRDSIDFYLK